MVWGGKNRKQQGGTNLWTIDISSEGNVYIADEYGKIADSTLIGDKLVIQFMQNLKEV
jgi:hypothetical protein